MKVVRSALDKAFMFREHKLLEVWHRVIALYMFLLLSWGAYRFLFRFPIWIEEYFLKGIVFGLPVFYLTFKKESFGFKGLGITSKNMFASVSLGVALGLAIGVIAQLGNFVRSGNAVFEGSSLTSAMFGGYIVLSLVTAFWEQLVFNGYILTKLKTVMKDEWNLVWVVAGLFSLLHLPALLFFHKLAFAQIVISMVLFLLLSVGTSVLRLRFENLLAPIMAHALWGIVVALFG